MPVGILAAWDYKMSGTDRCYIDFAVDPGPARPAQRARTGHAFAAGNAGQRQGRQREAVAKRQHLGELHPSLLKFFLKVR